MDAYALAAWLSRRNWERESRVSGLGTNTHLSIYLGGRLTIGMALSRVGWYHLMRPWPGQRLPRNRHPSGILGSDYFKTFPKTENVIPVMQ